MIITLIKFCVGHKNPSSGCPPYSNNKTPKQNPSDNCCTLTYDTEKTDCPIISVTFRTNSLTDLIKK